MQAYVIIIPARNEEEEIEKTITSVMSQTVLPSEMVLVDDGSTDKTGAIIDRFASEVKWIRAVHCRDRGYRSPGAGVMEAFYAGYDALQMTRWDYLVKLDADISLDPDYFHRCLDRFAACPTLGIGGGTVIDEIHGKPQIVFTPRFHVRGATKIYRRACWDALGGLERKPGWDTLDEVKANMLHWQTNTFSDIVALQRRPTGSRQGAWGDHVKNGRAAYISGYHPLFMLAKCLHRLCYSPYIVGSLGLGWGYLNAWLNMLERVEDHDLIRYMQREQLRCLFFAESIWK